MMSDVLVFVCVCVCVYLFVCVCECVCVRVCVCVHPIIMFDSIIVNESLVETVCAITCIYSKIQTYLLSFVVQMGTCTPWPFVFLLPFFLLVFLPAPTAAQITPAPPEEPIIDCPEGFFGNNCSLECHCLNGVEVCDRVQGICMDYQCDRGWRGAPYCQIR